jgi:hypothetical protein
MGDLDFDVGRAEHPYNDLPSSGVGGLIRQLVVYASGLTLSGKHHTNSFKQEDLSRAAWSQ